METMNDLADRLNRWIGLDHTFTLGELEILLWALASDRDLERDLRGAVADVRSDLALGRAEL